MTRSPHWGPLQPDPSHEGHQKCCKNPNQGSSSLEEPGKMPGEQEQAERRDLRDVPRLQPLPMSPVPCGEIPEGLSRPAAPRARGFAAGAGPAGIPAPSPAGPELLPDPPSKGQASALRARPRADLGVPALPIFPDKHGVHAKPSTGHRAIFTQHVFPIRASWSPSKHPTQRSKAINKVDTRSGVLWTLHAQGPLLAPTLSRTPGSCLRSSN